MKAASLLFLAFCTSPVWAQPVPRIVSVVNAASFQPSQVSLGGYVSIFGANLSDGTYVSPVPYPKKLGGTEVFVCTVNTAFTEVLDSPACDAVQIQYASPGQINAVLTGFSFTSSFGSRFLAVRLNGKIDAGPGGASPFNVQIQRSAPALFLAGRDCPIDSVPSAGGGPRWTGIDQNCGIFTQEPIPLPTGPLVLPSRANRGVITDLFGNLVWSGNPGRLGAFYTIWLTGLGNIPAGTSPAGLSVGWADIPAYGYKLPTIGNAKITYAGAVPQFPGLYQINFQVPTAIGSGPLGYGAWPCGAYRWELSLNVIYGSAADLVDFPLVIQSGDVACKP
ncbi:MAG: hypothetical protein JWN34_3705 [Bryobacterales bacterium]|nr:hypothetical protein [Bryobacterales bacterium]